MSLMPFAFTVMAHQAANAAKVTWARVLCRTAVMLGVFTSVASVLYFLADT